MIRVLINYINYIENILLKITTLSITTLMLFN